MDINKFIKKHEKSLDCSGGGRKQHFQLIIEKLVALNGLQTEENKKYTTFFIAERFYPNN